MNITMMNLDDIQPYANNPRKNDQAVDQVAQSIQEFGFNQPIVVDKNKVVVVGHTRLKAAKKLGLTHAPVLVVDNVSEDKLQAYRIADNKLNELAQWDDNLLFQELTDIVKKLGDADLTGFEYSQLLLAQQRKNDEWRSLNDKYLVPPFSILDGRNKDWLTRKNIWRDMGIRSEEGRADGLTYPSTGYLSVPGASTSVFDPVLTEILYLWYSPLGGSILDPFAGGSVRGIVAQMLGRSYTGIDLRQEQIEANKLNWADLQTQGRATLPRYATASPPRLQWIQGDSNQELDRLPPDDKYDLVFTCPPYADLEVYSDDPADISNMEYEDFLRVYTSIIHKAANRLKDNRFFVIVVGEVRGDKEGAYYNFVGHTIQACISAGLSYYNEAVFITPNGSLSMRTERPFVSSRKLGKHHQNTLIFVKGDGKRTREELNDMDQAYEQQQLTGQLLEKHEKVLVFSKGSARQAASEIGEVEVDPLHTLIPLGAADRIIASLSKTFNLPEETQPKRDQV